MSSTPPTPDTTSPLLTTALHALHLELGARMVPFAGYSMPVQYPSGLIAEHLHTRAGASVFDVSHMGQLRLVGPDAALALESLIPMDVIDLPVGMQRYGLLLNDEGGILDDLMFFKHAQDDLFVIVNGACKAADIAHMQAHIQPRFGSRCQLQPMPEHALLALQGPQAVQALSRLVPGVEQLVFMRGGMFALVVDAQRIPLCITRSGYTGEDGFEISVHQSHADALARALLAQPEVRPAGLGARNSLRLEAGLCLYGQDIDTTTPPAAAGLGWALQKVRRAGGARAGGYVGATKIIAAHADGTGAGGQKGLQTHGKQRVGLVALERVPVREHTALHDAAGTPIGSVTSGLLSPTLNQCIAMAYVDPAHASLGQQVVAMVRGKPVPMQVCAMPFVPTRYYRG